MITKPCSDPIALASYVRLHHGDRAFAVASFTRDENERVGNHGAADLWGRAASALWHDGGTQACSVKNHSSALNPPALEGHPEPQGPPTYSIPPS